ncbi:MAG: hypothetical protein NTW87_09825 [Planctomycetota bacterium]|nr:hypothetical protein [Planctomycetota bacterium]
MPLMESQEPLLPNGQSLIAAAYRSRRSASRNDIMSSLAAISSAERSVMQDRRPCWSKLTLGG